MSLEAPFLRDLETAAAIAQRSEIEFRNNIRNEIERHERERRHAFRRLEIARAMAAAMRAEEARRQASAAEGEGAGTACRDPISVEERHAVQIKALKAELGWHSDTDERKRVYKAFRPVADAIARQIDAAEAADEGEVRAAMLAFEAWYAATFDAAFLDILHEEMQELPVVEF